MTSSDATAISPHATVRNTRIVKRAFRRKLLAHPEIVEEHRCILEEIGVCEKNVVASNARSKGSRAGPFAVVTTSGCSVVRKRTTFAADSLSVPARRMTPSTHGPNASQSPAMNSSCTTSRCWASDKNFL